MSLNKYPRTPDGRYFVAAGRLWRTSDPRLTATGRKALTRKLMAARRKVRDAKDDAAVKAARREVNAAKTALGERGPVWWDDGAPDETRLAPQNSTYADWWKGLSESDKAAGMASPKSG